MAMYSLADEIIAENVENVYRILQTGVDINQVDEYGFTYIVEAAIANNVEIAKLLLQYGAIVDLPDMTGGTALHWAAENNNLALAKLLLARHANPNAYNFAGQPVLVMPILRRQREMKNLLIDAGADLAFAQDFINAKLLGHMFEIVGTANIVSPSNEFVEIDFEGFFLEFTLGIISESLSQFQNHFGSRRLRRYDQLTKIIVSVIDRAAQLIKFQQYRTNIAAHRNEIDELIKQEPLILPIGYEGHAITFVKFGNILAKCDRREDSRLYDNIFYYRMTRPENMTNDFIRQFLYEKKDDDFVNVILPEFLGLEPLTELKVEAQISGNCSWANVEAVIPTLFFMLLLATSPDDKNLQQFKSWSLNYFHQWRDWNKNRALRFCIQSFRSSDSIRNLCRAEILAAILYQRLREPHTEYEREQVEVILDVLRKPAYIQVLQNYIQTYCFESFSQEGKVFAALLKEHGLM